jgi:hypothetical protein
MSVLFFPLQFEMERGTTYLFFFLMYKSNFSFIIKTLENIPIMHE